MKLIRNVLLGVVSIVVLSLACADVRAANKSETSKDVAVINTGTDLEPHKDTVRLDDDGIGEGVFADEFRDFRLELEKLKRVKRLHLQAQEVKELKASLEQLRTESDTHKRNTLYKKIAKIIGGSLDQIETIVGVAVPVLTILTVFSVYRVIRNFLGLDTVLIPTGGRAYTAPGSPQSHGDCSSWWGWMLNSSC